LKSNELKSLFQPQSPDAAGIISWVHLGDLHMTRAGEQNHLDLAKIVDEVNLAFAGSVSFVFLPGDVADDGSRTAYSVVRGELDRLNVPWCAIVGDHDVQEKSFANFLEAMSEHTHYAFTVGSIRFVGMNAFDVPDPGSFVLSEQQLANDGRTLYSATRSTGQIEEGPVGYSVTNIDGNDVSWRFVELGKLPVVVITSPIDERLLRKSSETPPGNLKVRAKFWGDAQAERATAHLGGQSVSMKPVGNSQVWEADVSAPHEGVYSLGVSIVDARGNVATDEIRIVIGDLAERERAARDQDNALEAWLDHGLLGTQLGPNKNGKKW
jgi:3',5'-cyclic-AMP phosphodiesterase